MISQIHYTVSFKEPQAHYAEIELQIVNFTEEFITLKMPTWTPGSYLIREYARHVESLTAYSDEKIVEHEKIDKNTWRVKNEKEGITIKYAIYGFETSVRTNFIDSDHAFLSSAATFMYIDNYIDHPITIDVKLPSQWSKISTGLQAVPNKENCYYAANFDILFDSPLEMGNQDIWHFEAAGIQHEFAMVGGGSYNKKRLTEDITKIIEVETKIWGENPNDRYVFITHNYHNGYGGLEHLNSTVLAASRNAYKIPAAYKNFLSLVAHEYFHLWNVKRLRPYALGPFNYDEENYTEGLWIMEGFTSYYDNLIVRRAGLYSIEEYLSALANEFNMVYNRAGHKIQSAALASFDTWIKQYRPDENSPNTSISYYNKGAMLAVALDLKIISDTDGKLRLDDVLKAAYQLFYKEKERGFEEHEFKQLAEEITQVDLSEIFDAAHTTDELDYNSYFNRVGYSFINTSKDSNERSLGLKTHIVDGRILIKTTERNSAAWDAGLNVNDEIIAINNNRLDTAGKDLDFILETSEIDEILDILIARDGLIRTVHTPVRKSSKETWVIRKNTDASPRQKELGEIWLSE